MGGGSVELRRPSSLTAALCSTLQHTAGGGGWLMDERRMGESWALLTHCPHCPARLASIPTTTQLATYRAHAPSWVRLEAALCQWSALKHWSGWVSESDRFYYTFTLSWLPRLLIGWGWCNTGWNGGLWLAESCQAPERVTQWAGAGSSSRAQSSVLARHPRSPDFRDQRHIPWEQLQSSVNISEKLQKCFKVSHLSSYTDIFLSLR